MRVLDRWVGCTLIFLIGLLHRKKPRPSDVNRIGVLMFGAIGDALLSSAIIHDLRRAFPAAHIVAFVSSSNRHTLDLLEGPDSTVVTPIGRPHRAIPIIRGHKLDVLIDVGQWPRISALLAAMAGARYTIGFRTRGTFRHWAFDAIADHSSVCHEIDNFRALVGCLGITARSLPRIKRDILHAPTASGDGRSIVFHPWASGFQSLMREWRTENWIALAKVVLGKGYRIVITGGPEDAARSESMADAMGCRSEVTVLAGRASLRETAVALTHATAVVSVNTGIMHLGALMNRPTLALHGPTDPRRWGPLGNSSVVIGPGPECGCAFLNLGFEYPPSPPDCMSRITVGEVAANLSAMLGWIPVIESRAVMPSVRQLTTIEVMAEPAAIAAFSP
jgi:heptosyltransferase-3